MFKLSARHIATYLFMGLGFAVTMGFIYMQYVYYDAMIATLGVTNAQLGFLITIEAVIAFITSIPGGMIADKIDSRIAVFVGMFGMSATMAIFALMPTYGIAKIVWGVASALMSVWYCAIYKVVRVIAPPEAIGKSYGMFGAGVAIGSIIVNVAGLALYDHFAAESLTKGFSAIVWAFAIAGFIGAIGGFISARPLEVQDEEAEDDGGEKGSAIKELVEAIKDPSTWLYVFGCFSIYSFQVSISYFTPYFSSVLGTTVAFAGVVAVFRQYGLRIISAPVGGSLGDKWGSTAKVIRLSMLILTALVVVVLILPKSTPLAVLVAIVFILGLLGTMNISLQASISGDAMVPPKHMGVAVGLTSLVSADLFQETMFGSWLDKYGNQGYTYIWIYTICMTLFCALIMTLMIRRRAKLTAQNAADAE